MDSGGTIHPIWDDRNVLLEKNADFATQAIYTQLPGIWGGAFSSKRGATHYFLLPDLQGHTRQTVNASEALLASYFYDAWGREVWPIVGGGLYLRPFGQWGDWRDTASRLYVRARHLLPYHGRWMSRDPVGAESVADHAFGAPRQRPPADASGCAPQPETLYTRKDVERDSAVINVTVWDLRRRRNCHCPERVERRFALRVRNALEGEVWSTFFVTWMRFSLYEDLRAPIEPGDSCGGITWRCKRDERCGGIGGE